MRKQWVLSCVGWFSLVLGMVFYVVVRGYLVSPFLPIDLNQIHVVSVLSDSFPSFIHSFALVILTVAYGFRLRVATSVWLCLSVLLELGQLPFGFGTFDVRDLYASALGVILSCVLVTSVRALDGMQGMGSAAAQGLGLRALLLLGLSTSVASMGDRTVPEPAVMIKRECSFAYLSYDELRGSFAVEEPRPAKTFGKILVLGDLLIVSEPNVGVHIFDNSNPSYPLPRFFLNIPGNVDLAARNGVLYADSFVDLLAIRIGDDTPTLLQRKTDVFEWRPYQAIGNQRISSLDRPDRSKGVIVGVKVVQEDSSRVLNVPTFEQVREECFLYPRFL